MPRTKKAYRIASIPPSIMNDRFIVQASSFELEKASLSIMITVFDVVNCECIVRFFSSDDEAEMFINMIREV